MSQVLNTGVFGTTELDTWPLINEEIARDVIAGVTEGSAALSLFDRLPDMAARVLRLPVLNTIGAAHFVSDVVFDNPQQGTDEQFDDERQKSYGPPDANFPNPKKTHQFEWENVYINAEEIAIVLPVPEAVVEDSNYDIWEQMKPRIIEAFHQSIDNAIIWGQGRPTTWPSAIVPTAVARGYTVGANAGVDFADSVSMLMSLLEQDGKRPTGFLADPSVLATLRGLRDANGMPIYQPIATGPGTAQLWGLPLNYVWNNTFAPAISPLIVGAMNEAKYSIRHDIRFKVFDSGVITDQDKNIVFNLLQEDMLAMRVVMRLGWAVPNSIHKMAQDRSLSYPFAVLTTDT
jgi:HK97 family phage major capsid protein